MQGKGGIEVRKPREKGRQPMKKKLFFSQKIQATMQILKSFKIIVNGIYTWSPQIF